MKEIEKGDHIVLSVSAALENKEFFEQAKVKDKIIISVAEKRYGCKIFSLNERTIKHDILKTEQVLRMPIIVVDKVYRNIVRLSPKDLEVNGHKVIPELN